MEFLNRKNQGYPLVYTRTDGKETYLICINPTGAVQQFALQNLYEYQMVLQNKEVVVEQGILTLPEVSFWVAKKTF